MLSHRCLWLSLLALVMAGTAIQAQDSSKPTQLPPPASPPPSVPPPPLADQVAATVNGQKIFEIAVYRALMRVPPEKRDQARPEIVNFLVENMLIDQYLEGIKVPVDPAEVTRKIDELKTEIAKGGGTFEELLKKLFLNEAELKAQITGALRWDNFVDKQAPDKVLEDMFTKNKNMFDQSMVRARHILIKPLSSDAAGLEQAKAKIVEFRKHIDGEVAQQLAKLPATTDALKREEARRKAIDDAFSALASKESSCPSSKNGGELGWFVRLGMMVEPFARAAFALKPYEMSDPVVTEFGVHLILAVDQKPGKDVKFADVKPMVKEVYAERLRDAVLQQMRPRARIEIMPVKK